MKRAFIFAFYVTFILPVTLTGCRKSDDSEYTLGLFLGLSQSGALFRNDTGTDTDTTTNTDTATATSTDTTTDTATATSTDTATDTNTDTGEISCGGITSPDFTGSRSTVSSDYTYTHIKKYTGLNPGEHASILRLNRAYHLLKQGHSIQDILYTCGYYDQSHFIKEFKRYTCHTPYAIQKDPDAHSIFLNRIYTFSSTLEN